MKYNIYTLAMSNIHINCRLFVQSTIWQHYPDCFHGSWRLCPTLSEQKSWNNSTTGILIISVLKQDTGYLSTGWPPLWHICIYCFCLVVFFSVRMWTKSFKRDNNGQKRWSQRGHITALILNTFKSGIFSVLETNICWKVSIFIYTNTFLLFFS